MKIHINELVEENSSHIGKKLWISDFRQDDLDKKPIRCVRPQMALLRSNTEINSRKRIHYSDNHFVGLNKKGEPSKSKIIAIFDNTGYRSYPGEPIQIFDDEQECRAAFITQAEEIGQRVDERIKSATKHWESVRQDINKEINDNKG